MREQSSALRRPSVVMLEWTDPTFAMGNWGPELVEFANGELLLGRKGEFSTAISAEQLRDAYPEYLIVAPCGFNLERSLLEQPLLGAASLVAQSSGGTQWKRGVCRRQSAFKWFLIIFLNR